MNVLIDDNYRAKLADFGDARILTSNHGSLMLLLFFICSLVCRFDVAERHAALDEP